jgi:hypothetical protein
VASGVSSEIEEFHKSTNTTFWQRIDRLWMGLARKRVLCWVGAGALVLALRLAILPFWQIPKPIMWDEFAYLLQADTFASGRLTNPPHLMGEFFESPYILQTPTYNAKYPPGQGLLLGLGQLLLDHAWFGVWIGCGVLLSAICWCLQGWLPPHWALLGTIFAFPLCAFSYWVDTYWGGALAATGGALVLGAYPRLVRRRQMGYAWILGAGLVILANTRMYEGLLFVIPILIALLRHKLPIRMWAATATMLAGGAVFFLVYNHAVTGNALRMPYQEYQRQFGYVPNFNVLPLNPSITYKNDFVGRMHLGWEF